jgi:hypothetical protein
MQRALQSVAPAGVGPGAAVPLAPDETAVLVLEAVEPVNVEMSDVPAGVLDPNNQYDRWLRGEIDMESESIVSQVEMEAMRQASLSLPPMPESASMQSVQSSNVATFIFPGVQFAGPDINDCCGGGANVPPDPELAVGKDHLIAVINVSFTIYDKQGNILKPATTFASLFQSVGGCDGKGPYGVFDPNVLYDEEADRFMMAIDGNGVYYCVAVSQSANPLGAWNLYRFTMNSGDYFFDYPHAGIGRDAIYVGGNMFSGLQYSHSRIWALPKWAMYSNQPATAVQRTLSSIHSTPQPLKLHGFLQGTWPSSGPHYILVETGFNAANHTLFAWSDPTGANSFSTVGSFNLVTTTGVQAGMPINAPQSGGPMLQANDFRPLDFEYRNGYGWTAMTIGCNPGSGPVNCIRWAQINLSSAAVVQAGVLASNAQHRFFPDLAVNHNNDMLVGYTRSSSNTFPSVYVAGRDGNHPPGTLPLEMQLKVGEIAYTSFEDKLTNPPPAYRWGDYTGMTIDPDGETFWYIGQYSKVTGNPDGRWGTYIASLQLVGCDTAGISCNFLPAVAKPAAPPPPPNQPAAGLWQGPYETFYVTPAQNAVDKFTTYINVNQCGNYAITRHEPVPINDNAFAFSGSFYASGNFHDTTHAGGTVGLSSFYIPGCGYVSGGPYVWDASWQNESQPAFVEAQAAATAAEPVTDSAPGPFRAIRLDE